jgi:AI-2 transport protein TqsA
VALYARAGRSRILNTSTPHQRGVRDEQIFLALGSLMILAAVAIAVSLYYTQDVMIPFVLAIFVTTMVSPLVDFLVVRGRVPGWLAIVLALLLVVGVLTLLGLALMVAVQAIVHTADEYTAKVVELARQAFAKLAEYGIHVGQAQVVAELEGHMPSAITQAAGTATSLVSKGLLISIFVVFLLAGRNPRRSATGIYADIEATIRSYIVTKTIISAVTGLLVGLILWMLGLRMAPLFGLLAFLLNYIPSIGSIIAMLLPLPIAITQFDNPAMVVAVVALPGSVHLTVGSVVEPKLMGRGLELHPVTVLLALAFFGLLWGVVGMVLAVPIAAIFRIVLSRFATTRPLGDLLAGQLPGAEPMIAVE